jgi:mycothiol synthase
MMADSREADGNESGPSTDRLQQILLILGDQLATNTIIALAEDGKIVASAIVYIPPEEDEKIAMVEGVVHANYRKQGIGRYLLDWMEARAREEFSKTEDGKPQIIRTSCAGYQKDRIALFEQQGYKPVRYSYKMQRNLAAPIKRTPLPGELEIVPWAPELDRPLMEAFNAAFSEHYGVPTMNEDLWHMFFTGVPQFRADLSYLAMTGNTIAGFCVNWVEEREEAPGGKEGWIEAIGVIPAWRGRGVASALMERALNQFRAAGLERVALDVDAENPTGALRLYEKHGFVVARESIHFAKILN